MTLCEGVQYDTEIYFWVVLSWLL